MSERAATPTDPTRVIVVLAVLAFVGLGLPEGAIGVTFPQIRLDFDQPLSALGLLLFPYTGGYIAATLSYGPLLSKAGTGRVLVAAAVCALGGACLYAFGPAFVVLMIGSLLLGASAGGIDASLNSYVAVHLPHRVLALMHGGFGVGATLGPLGVTALLNSGASWRVAYGFLAVVQIGLVLAWLRVRHRFVGSARTTTAATAGATAPTDQGAEATLGVGGPPHHLPLEPPQKVAGYEGDIAEVDPTDAGPAWRPPPRPALVRWLNRIMFFLYTGTEGSTGFLVATLLTARGVDPAAAGLLTTAYWGALAAGRFATGAVGARVAPSRALLGACAGTVIGLLLVWLGGTAGAGLGLLITGLSLAPIFPSLVSLTPSRVGPALTSSAIGFQLTAASLGVSFVPFLIARLAEQAGDLAIGPALLAVGVLLAVVHLVTATAAGDLWRGARHMYPGGLH